jgi:acetylornithine deacetylase/succinyl-diaminopimelate desuccinylase-like protein
MHSPDEYIYVEDFIKDIAIYARAIYALGTAK